MDPDQPPAPADPATLAAHPPLQQNTTQLGFSGTWPTKNSVTVTVLSKGANPKMFIGMVRADQADPKKWFCRISDMPAGEYTWTVEGPGLMETGTVKIVP